MAVYSWNASRVPTWLCHAGGGGTHDMTVPTLEPRLLEIYQYLWVIHEWSRDTYGLWMDNPQISRDYLLMSQRERGEGVNKLSFSIFEAPGSIEAHSQHDFGSNNWYLLSRSGNRRCPFSNSSWAFGDPRNVMREGEGVVRESSHMWCPIPL